MAHRSTRPRPGMRWQRSSADSSAATVTLNEILAYGAEGPDGFYVTMLRWETRIPLDEGRILIGPTLPGATSGFGTTRKWLTAPGISADRRLPDMATNREVYEFNAQAALDGQEVWASLVPSPRFELIRVRRPETVGGCGPPQPPLPNFDKAPSRRFPL